MKKLPLPILILGILLYYAATGWTNPGGTSHAAEAQTIPDYETARKVFWRELYRDGGKTLYCQQKLVSGYNRGVNIEHVFPASWIAYDLRCGKRKQCRQRSAEFNRMEADLHNLYPSRTDVNKARANYRFGVIPGEQRVLGKCDFEFDEKHRIAEPTPSARGRIARAMLYMKAQHDLYLKRKLETLLIDWDKKHPPLPAEHKRNDRIEKLQGNRNPYIDAHIK